MNRNLSNITAADLGGAKTKPNTNEFPICPAGTHVAKILAFDEQETYNLVSVEIEGVRYNFFYNYFIFGTTDFDADVLNWIMKLATIEVKEDTSLQEIANSAIGCSYKIEVYNYTPKKGKNAGKVQHGIQFSKAPELTVVEVVTEDFVLPY